MFNFSLAVCLTMAKSRVKGTRSSRLFNLRTKKKLFSRIVFVFTRIRWGHLYVDCHRITSQEEALSEECLGLLLRNTQEIDFGIYSQTCTTFKTSIQFNYRLFHSAMIETFNYVEEFDQLFVIIKVEMCPAWIKKIGQFHVETFTLHHMMISWG